MKLFLVTIIFLSSLVNFTYSWSYPLQEVSKPSCKFEHWIKLWDNCKMTLPRIKNADYKKYKSDMLYRRLYSILWMSTYNWWWDVWLGTHLWVDMPTAEGTPVYAIGDGKVVWGWAMKWWWKTVVIRHYLGNNRYLYSNYSHLSKVVVNAWSIVKEWVLIGNVWSTGISFGNHLHFQLDITQSVSGHPWYHGACAKWTSIFNIVNGTVCQEDALASTIDPIYFLETNWVKINDIFQKEIIIDQNKQRIEEQHISRDSIVSAKQLRMTDMEMFLSRYKFDINVYPAGGIIQNWKYWKMHLSVGKWNGKPYYGQFPTEIEVEYDTNHISSLYPRGIKIIEWSREISFLSKKAWITYISIKIGDTYIVRNIPIRIVDNTYTAEPVFGTIWILGRNHYINEEKYWYIVLKDKSFNKLIWFPYKGKYRLTSDNKDIKLCHVKVTSKKDVKMLKYHICNVNELKDKLNFTYMDTTKWVYIFKVIWWKKGKYTLKLEKDDKRIWYTMRKSILRLKDIDTSFYKKEINYLMDNFVLTSQTKKWYFQPKKKLSKYDTKFILHNFVLNMQNNLWIVFPYTKLEINSQDKFKYFTRLEFAKLVIDTLWYKPKKYTRSDYIDIKWDNINYTQTLRKIGLIWKDKYGERYFQPDEYITREEAVYLLWVIFLK